MGTSLVENISDTIDEDHPHACGDKPIVSVLSRFSSGSSPRVWGQDSVNGLLRSLIRIIPTRVGTSCRLLSDVFR